MVVSCVIGLPDVASYYSRAEKEGLNDMRFDTKLTSTMVAAIH